MSSEPISQAEIDALLRGGNGGAAAGTPSGDAALTVLKSMAEPAMESAWSVAEALLGQPAGIANLTVQRLAAEHAAASFGPDLIYGRVTMGHFGPAYALIPQGLALQLVGLMLGGVVPAELSATGAAALAEALGQLVTKGVVKLASQAGQQVIPSPVEVIPAAAAPAAGLPDGSDSVILLRHDVLLGDTSGPVGVLLPADLVQAVLDGVGAPEPARAPAQSAAGRAPAPTLPAPAPEPAGAIPFQPFQFRDLAPPGSPGPEPRNMDLLMDVPLQVTVELGRTRKQIREVLALGPGSVLELEKLAGEPVDVLVNGKLIAKGEVVVIDEHFGVRITDIVSPAERAASLK